MMTDQEIVALLSMKKSILNPNARWSVQKSSKQKNYKVLSKCGKEFYVYLRQNLKIEDSFSCGLRCTLPNGDPLTLCRYNGSDHDHENPLDGREKIIDSCHIHKATERYIMSDYKPDHYAEATDRYWTLQGAFQALCEDCNISNPKQVKDDDLFL